MRKITLALILLLGLIVAAGVGLASDQLVEENHPHEDSGAAPHQDRDYCAGCHACEEPTREDPCLVSCPRHAGKFVGKHHADEGPEVVLIDQLANLYEPVVFAHRLHADMSEMTGGCENCHHYSEESGIIPACRECHEVKYTANTTDLNMPALKGAYHRQCMNCHVDWSNDTACAFCHAEANGDPSAVQHDPTDIVGVPHPMIEATPSYNYETTYADGPVVTFHHADHVDMFGLDCVACHRGDSCAKCHDSTGQKEPVKLDHVNSCYTCHGERDCSFCHSQEPKPQFDHAVSVGWKLDPYHSEVQCQTCHGDPKTYRTPSGHCADSHIHWEVGSFDHAATGLALSEDHVDLDCDSCHMDMTMEAKPSCEDCHDDQMYPEYLPGIRTGAK
jgi:hypothetical protein